MKIFTITRSEKKVITSSDGKTRETVKITKTHTVNLHRTLTRIARAIGRMGDFLIFLDKL